MTATQIDGYDEYAALLDAVRGIRWPARTAVRGGIPGAHTSRLRGISAEFTEYRPYRQGDDTRRVDWKLFARSDRAYIRLSNDRAILPTMSRSGFNDCQKDVDSASSPSWVVSWDTPPPRPATRLFGMLGRRHHSSRAARRPWLG